MKRCSPFVFYISLLLFLAPLALQGVPFVEAVAPPHGTFIDSQAAATYVHASTGVSATLLSNRVRAVVQLAEAPAQLSYYTDNTYTTVVASVGTGAHLSLLASAARCNAPNPDRVPTLTLTSSLTGDRETFTLMETGPHTGKFSFLDNIPTRDGTVNPVEAGNGIVETRKDDEIIARYEDACGGATATILVDPAGTVFNSKTNTPIAGVTVTLIDVTGGGNGGVVGGLAKVLQSDGIGIAPSTVTTGLDGFFQFPLVAPSTYQVHITPSNGFTFPSIVPIGLLPPGRTIDPSGSYGGTFFVNNAAGPITLDVPLDAGPTAGLFIDKTPSKTIAELGDLVDYTIKVNNNTGIDQPNVMLIDHLPIGFAYIQGSARLDNVPITNPSGGGGPALTFSLGTIAVNNKSTLTYSVRIGPGALLGDGINSALAQNSAVVSNTAKAHVKVTGGVFSDQGFIVGKIFVDCNHNYIQDNEELGIPGVRLYLEDGTFAITDSEGKYSFYGITPHTHVLKLDPLTLPNGAAWKPIANRHGGVGTSRFIDLKKGELHRADFAEGSCSQEVIKEIKARRAKGEVLSAEIEKAVNPPLLPNVIPVDPKTLPASGIIGPERTVPNPSSQALSFPSAPLLSKPKTAPDLLSKIKNVDNTFGLIDIKDQDILPIAQTNLLIKGMAGNVFTVYINGKEIAADRVGKKIVIAEKQVQVWEVVGIDLKPGKNSLRATQQDPFGNIRGEANMVVIAPGPLARIKMTLPKEGTPAEGETPAMIQVRLEDADGILVTTRTPLTLATSLGRLQVEDSDPKEPGVQLFLEGGVAEYALLPPQNPGKAEIQITSGALKVSAFHSFLPSLRPMMAVGLVEGTIHFNQISTKSFVPARKQDGFEEEVHSFADSNGKTQEGGRAALFLKGKVAKEYLLTLGYDSDKETKEPLFRDIQPDQFYPVYGDASIKGFDAQSTSPLYLRVDKNKSNFLVGDFSAQSPDASHLTTMASQHQSSVSVTPPPSKVLGAYNRSFNGMKEHYESDGMAINVYGSRDDLRQVVEEIPALGISGPYFISRSDGVPNSEKIEWITRDRKQPSIIIKRVFQTRLTDYAFESFSGRILFNAPVASLDQNLNPVFIRVTYEIEQGGKPFWVIGTDGQFKLTHRMEAGGSFVKDQNPEDAGTLASLNLTYLLSKGTYLVGEVAETEKSSTGVGNAIRVELKHMDEKAQSSLTLLRADPQFSNLSAGVTAGRIEVTGKNRYQMNPQTLLVDEGQYSEGIDTHDKRYSGLTSFEKSFDNKIKLLFGTRYGREQGLPGRPDNTIVTLRTKITSPVYKLPDASVYGEYERDVLAWRQRKELLGIGGDYTLSPKSRLYARYELISSLDGPNTLNSSERRYATVFGMTTEYMQGGQLFTEYRGRDAFPGRDTEAAIGLKNLWTISEGVKISGTLERVKTLTCNPSVTDGTAITSGIEYTRSPLWKGSARLEVRESQTTDSFLSTLGLARKLDRDWTVLGKNIFFRTNTQGAPAGAGENFGNRFLLGIAYRETDTNRLSGLGKIEYRREKGVTTSASVTPIDANKKRDIYILSTHLNYQGSKANVESFRYATKWGNDVSHLHLASLRVTHDLTSRWDVGVITSVLSSSDGRSQQYGLGAELGRIMAANLWVSSGFNLLGFKDKDLVDQDDSSHGFYFRIRWKFDEESF